MPRPDDPRREPEVGRTVYGLELGIMMLDTRFARPVGDVGNAATFPFPVSYKVVEGATMERVVGRTDPELLEPFLLAAAELEAEGVAAITTSCGFLAAFQGELAATVSVPVLTSALLQVPMAAAVAGAGRRVAVITGREGQLDERHFRGAGWSVEEVPVTVRAFADNAAFPQVYSTAGGTGYLSANPDLLEREMLELAAGVLEDAPDVGAFVFECTNFSPYADAVRRATRLPVFDFLTLIGQAMAATGRRPAVH